MKNSLAVCIGVDAERILFQSTREILVELCRWKGGICAKRLREIFRRVKGFLDRNETKKIQQQLNADIALDLRYPLFKRNISRRDSNAKRVLKVQQLKLLTIHRRAFQQRRVKTYQIPVKSIFLFICGILCRLTNFMFNIKIHNNQAPTSMKTNFFYSFRWGNLISYFFSLCYPIYFMRFNDGSN